MLVATGLLVGCAGETTETGSESAEINELKLTLGEGSVTDSPKLKAGAEGSLECTDRFEIDGRTRLTCFRGEEKLEVIQRNGEALLVHKPKKTADKEQFFSCSVSGNKLNCKNAPLRDHAAPGGGLASPFDPSVEQFSIANAHAVGKSGKLFRSMAPGSPEEFDQIFKADIGAILIFKNPTTQGHSVDEEIETLKQRGLENVVNVPFQWKDLPDFQQPCEQTIQGLKFLRDNLKAKKNVLFHCTVGEDRTGFLAAMHNMLTEKKEAVAAWDGDMCERGYGAGNPLKPGFVVGELEDSLKPLYQKMAYLAATGALDDLDESVCKSDPSKEADFEAKAPKLARLTCGTSTLFVP